jgi:hypothetical protein
MQMRLFVFALREHAPRISHVEYASQATGLGGVVANKGGVVSVLCTSSSISFSKDHTHLYVCFLYLVLGVPDSL